MYHPNGEQRTQRPQPRWVRQKGPWENPGVPIRGAPSSRIKESWARVTIGPFLRSEARFRAGTSRDPTWVTAWVRTVPAGVERAVVLSWLDSRSQSAATRWPRRAMPLPNAANRVEWAASSSTTRLTPPTHSCFIPSPPPVFSKYTSFSKS